MPNQNPAPAADTQPVEITAALVTERAPAVAEAFRAEGRTAGATAERERILAIQAHGTTAAHRPIIEAAVADPNCTADQAAARILAAERAAREAQAGAIRGDEEELEAPTPNAGTGTQGGAREEAARVVAIHHQLRGESPARQGTAR